MSRSKKVSSDTLTEAELRALGLVNYLAGHQAADDLRSYYDLSSAMHRYGVDSLSLVVEESDDNTDTKFVVWDVDGVLVKCTGYYSSYNDDSWRNDWKIVEAKTVTLVVYE